MRRKRSQNLISRQYDKRGLFVESLHRMKTNPGAMFGMAVLIITVLMMLYSFIFISYADVIAINPSNRFATPSAAHPFGTDNMGRDLLLRVVYGTRYSLAVGFGAIAFASIIGTFLGATAGYYGGLYEDIVMRSSDVLASLPSLLLGMVIVTVLGNSLTVLILAVGVSAIPNFIRMARASVISVRGLEFVEASHAIGMSNFRIVFSQVLPNSLSPLIVSVTTRVGSAITDAASLSFLGFGISAPTPEWGALVSTGRTFVIEAPHIALFAGLFIMVTTFACALLGDGLRDALDPKLKK